MTTVLETMTNISEIIQETFSELIKLTLRKTIRPTLNPLSRNTRILYNARTNRYERGFVGFDPSDSVNKYTYHMVTDTIGWLGNAVVTFKISPKTNPYIVPGRGQVQGPRLPLPVSPGPLGFSDRVAPFVGSGGVGSGPPPTSSSPLSSIGSFQPLGSLGPVGPPHPPRPSCQMGFRQFMESIATRTATGTISNTRSGVSNRRNGISNRRGGAAHICTMTYTDGFEQLNSIGSDIVDQTDPLVAPIDSSRMSTSLLRAKLFNLNRLLLCFAETYPDLYCCFLDMVRLINSENYTQTLTITSLIGALSVVDWIDLPPIQQDSYVNRLGQDFITDFNSNELIAILLKSEFPELILTTSFYYSLQKMLYIVFGFNNLVPNLFSRSDPLVNPNDWVQNEGIRRYPYRTMGAYVTREAPGVLPVLPALPPRTLPFDPDCMPPPQSDYDFIKIFCELYPTVVETMGGCNFPEPCQNLFCSDIRPNYCHLFTLQKFLLHFTEYSYCQYLAYLDTKLLRNAVGVQIDNRIRYLKTF